MSRLVRCSEPGCETLVEPQRVRCRYHLRSSPLAASYDEPKSRRRHAAPTRTKPGEPRAVDRPSMRPAMGSPGRASRHPETERKAS